jgi:hypothetical protein
MSPPTPGAEVAALLRYLDAQRRHVLGILEGLDEAALRLPILPSGWTCLGLVQHLALDVERFWFQAVVSGAQAVIDWFATAPDAWQVGTQVPAAAVFDLYRQECERANAIISATPPDTAPAWWPTELFGERSMHTLREVVLHVMTETATHAGHLDAARELIDHRQWRVLT